MDHIRIWRFARDILCNNMKPICHTAEVPHFDVWKTTDEGELALALLFNNRTEHEFEFPAVTSGGVTEQFVLRPDGIYIKCSSWESRKTATYRLASTDDTRLDYEAFKRSVVSHIREKVDRYTVNVISYRLLKQYKDRDAKLDALFGTQDY